MIHIVEKFLLKYNLTDSENTFLVGFSGGCDSLCLLDILADLRGKFGFKVVALHLNHNWRGEESKNEEINCKNYCEKRAIAFISETLSSEVQKSETCAREARYEFFTRVAKMHENGVIFTAHTATDNAETLIYRITKGTGIKGLQGIAQKSEVNGVELFRPILEVSRENTQNYCKAKGLIANNDSSNSDVKYKRNFIRHKVMPELRELNPLYEKAITSLAGLASDSEKIINEYMNFIKKDIYVENKILTDKFKNLSSEIMRKLIHDVCIRENWDYDYKKISDILKFLKENFNSKAGSKYSVAKDVWIFANKKYIFLTGEDEIMEEYLEISIPKEGEYKIPNSDFVFCIEKFLGQKPEKFPSEQDFNAYVSFGGFENLVLRHRLPKDFICPFGMNGKMKLKKYLNSKGILQKERNSIFLLCSGDEVLWAIGVGLSNKLKVVNLPTHVIKLEHIK